MYCCASGQAQRRLERSYPPDVSSKGFDKFEARPAFLEARAILSLSYPKFLHALPEHIPGGVGRRAINYILKFVPKELTHSDTTGPMVANSREATARRSWGTTQLLNVVHCPPESVNVERTQGQVGRSSQSGPSSSPPRCPRSTLVTRPSDPSIGGTLKIRRC